MVVVSPSYHALRHTSICILKKALQQSAFDAFKYAPEAQLGGDVPSMQDIDPPAPHTGKKSPVPVTTVVCS